jgi:uncharacterized protein (DUF2345 family)
LRDQVTHEPLRNTHVELRRGDGAVLKLVTDAEGRLPMQKGISMEQIQLRVLGKLASNT